MLSKDNFSQKQQSHGTINCLNWIRLLLLVIGTLLLMLTSSATAENTLPHNTSSGIPGLLLYPQADCFSPNHSLEFDTAIKEFQEKQQAAEKEHRYYQQQHNKLLQRLQKIHEQLDALEPIDSLPQTLNNTQRQKKMGQASELLFTYVQHLQKLTGKLIENAEHLKNLPQHLIEISAIIKTEEETLKNMQFSSMDHDTQSSIEKQYAKLNYYYAQQKNLLKQNNYYEEELKVIDLEIAYINKQHQKIFQQQIENKKIFNVLSLDSTQIKSIEYLENNIMLIEELVIQHKQLQKILSEKRNVDKKIFDVTQELNKLERLATWKISNPKASQKFRSQILKLTSYPDLRQIPKNIDNIEDKKSIYEKKLEQEDKNVNKQSDILLPKPELTILKKERDKYRWLLNAIIKSSDNIIDQFDELYIKNSELIRQQQRLQSDADRRLFWIADANPVRLNFLVMLAKDIREILHQRNIFITYLRSITLKGSYIALLSLMGAALLLEWSIQRKHVLFLQRTAARVGNVTQDSFSLTTATVTWALGATLPLPLAIMAVGHILQESTADTLGGQLLIVMPLLWILRVCADFAHPQGLFIKHFGWDSRKVSRLSRYYFLVAGVILPLMMLLSLFNQLEGHKYAETLGRTTFSLLCIILWILIIGIKHAGVTFYITKKASAQNFVNRLLWMLLIGTPLLANLFALFGYVTASRELLFRLMGSIGIWFSLLITYHLAWRWMLIQRRRLAFERAKQRRASKLAQRARIEDELSRIDQNLEMQLLDLNTMSSRSLQLLRSLIAMATLMALIAWWSKMHPAFGFLENVALWHVDAISQGAQTIKSVTLRDIFKAIFFIVITTQLVRNLPAVLELALLQHLDLTHGTSYAITTVTKYLLTLIGGFVVIYLLGIDWPKIQWVATALGVGLGFGLKDIFANFISGLILLFEKPIRIGDTVTVRDIHGTVTRISTRATVVTDWDRKEIIIPNHTLVIEQFINWTLSDTVVRLVLQLAAPSTIDPKIIKKLIRQATKKCTLLLVNPAPEIYLNDLQQGLQTFEVRLYAAEPSHRMPLRHEFHERILFLYRKNNITLPYPPTQIRIETLSSTLEERRNYQNAQRA